MMTPLDALKRLRIANTCPDVALSETLKLIQEDAWDTGFAMGRANPSTNPKEVKWLKDFCFMHAGEPHVITRDYKPHPGELRRKNMNFNAARPNSFA